MAFPTSPVHGQIYNKYTYDSTKQAWTDGPVKIDVSNAMLENGAGHTSYMPYYVIHQGKVSMAGHISGLVVTNDIIILPSHLIPTQQHTYSVQMNSGNVGKLAVRTDGVVTWFDQDVTEGTPSGVYLDNVSWYVN